MGELIFAGFDTFRPRRPAKDKETEIAVAAAVNLLAEIEVWARARREIAEHRAEPPSRETVRKALAMQAIAKDQPINE